jgi:hypothetical protein
MDARQSFRNIPIFQNDSIKNVSAVDASPAPKMFITTVKLLVKHQVQTTGTPHMNHLLG